MTARRYQAPQATSAMIEQDGRPTPEWQRYLNGIEELSKREAGAVTDLGGGATLADVINKVNELLAAHRAANQMES